jgi:methionyl-tRNA formyltransferase
VRLVFFGTPVEAADTLRALHDAGHEIALVVTQPDKRRGRGTATSPSPVRSAAESLGVPVLTPAKAREIVDDVAASGATLGVVVAFGQLLPPALLAGVPGGFVNVHFSLLPRWRGAAPVERAVLAGDDETGVCIMQIDEGLDTGPVYARAATPIAPDETAGALRGRLAALGTELLVRTLPDIESLHPEPQHGEVTVASKLTVEEFRLDPSRSADELARVVRAGNPRPGAWFIVNDKRVKVRRAHVDDSPEGGVEQPGVIRSPGVLSTVSGGLVLDEVEVEGRRAMPATDWLNGLRTRDVELDPAPQS